MRKAGSGIGSPGLAPARPQYVTVESLSFLVLYFPSGKRQVEPPPCPWGHITPPGSSYSCEHAAGAEKLRAEGRKGRLTSPSHQRGQDLQVLGLLNIKEGEGPEEESEDSLDDENRSEGGAEVRWGVGGQAVHTASACFRLVQPACSPGLAGASWGQPASPGKFPVEGAQQECRAELL